MFGFLAYKIHIPLIFLVLGLTFQTSSQVWIGDTTVVEHEHEYSFSPTARKGSGKVVNEILQLLAEGNQQLRVFTKYQWNAQMAFTLKQGDEYVNISMEMLQTHLSGDFYYRDFLVHDMLIPGLLDLQILLKNEHQEPLDEFVIKDIHWQNYWKGDSIFAFPIRQEENHRLEIKKVSFHYDENRLKKVTGWRKAYASYYAASEEAQQAFSLIQDLDSADDENAILDEFRLCEAEVLAAKLQTAPFHEQLNLQQNDPGAVLSLLDSLQNALTDLRSHYNYLVSHIDRVLYANGRQHLMQGDTAQARRNFERALVYNSLYIPAHVEMGYLELQAGEVSSASSRFENLLGPAPLPGKWEDIAVEFSSYLFRHQMDLAAETMQDGRFLDALETLTRLEEFCHSAVQWDCPESLGDSIAEVHYGMYRSFLTVARRAYISESYSFAETYVESAREYQADQQQYIPDDAEAMLLLNNVADGYLRLAEEAQQRNDFVAMEKNMNHALELCRKNPGLDCREDLADLARQARKKREQAERLTLEYVVREPEADPQEMTLEQVKEFVLKRLSEANLKAWASETTEAREYLNEILEYALRFDLRTDPNINDRIVNLTEKITRKECELRERDIISHIATVHDYMQRGLYIEANESYQMAHELNNLSRECDYAFDDTLQMLSYAGHAAQYQILINQAQRAYFQGAREGFDRFITDYLETESFYNRYHLQQYSINHQSLYDFVAESSNIDLMKEVVEHYTANDLHTEALGILRVLQSKRLDARELQSLQEYAGRKAALFIAEKHPDIKHRAYVRNKTENDNWFRFYVRSFIRNWP